MRTLRLAVCLVPLLGLARVGVADPDPADQAAHAAVEALVQELQGMRDLGLGSPEIARRAAGMAGELARTPEGVAALLESGRFEVKTSVAGKLSWTGGEASLEFSGGSMTATLPLAPLTSLQTTVGERKLGVGTSSKVFDLGGGEVKVSGGVEAEYATNKDFYAALPVPGLRHMHALLDHKLGEYEAQNPEPESRAQESPGLRGAVDAAATEAVDAFKSAVGWVVPKQATFQSNVSYSHGSVEISSSANTHVNFAEPDKLIRQSADVTIKLSKEAGVRNASLGAGLSLTYKFDSEAKPTPEASELAAAIRAGDGDRAAELVLLHMGPIALSEADLALAREIREKAADAAVLAAGQVVATADPIGGVSLHFSPTVTGSGSTPAEYGRILRDIGRLRREGASGFAIQAGGKAALRRVPLERALEADDLGLTRVRGWVRRKDGEIELIGEDEPGRSPVPRDYLVVALRAIFVEGLAPFISLDPDPRDFSGAQKVRVGGLPDGLEATAFVKAMIDADYLMKRLDLGRLKVPAVSGYRSSVDLLETWPDPPADLMSRLWLVPEMAPVGDVYRHEDERGVAVLFHSRIRVLTETLKRAGSSLLGAGQSHPMADAAAESLTANLPRLARLPECEDFARLEQVFDVSKLSAAWRAAGVDHPSIRRIAAIEPARVEHAATYPGIGPVPVRGGTYFMSGGASARARMRERPPHALPALAAILAGPAAEVSLPATLPLDGSELHGVNAELLANAALADLLEGRYAKAKEALDRAVAEDPDLDAAHAFRALAHHALGDFAPALADVDVAARREPGLRALKAMIEACAGREREALADCEAVEQRFPDDTDLLSIAASARFMAGDFEGCDRTAALVAAVTPLSHEALALRDQLDAVYRGSGADAARRVTRLRDVPLAVQNGVGLGQEAMAGFQFPAAVEQFRAALAAARIDDRPRVKAQHVRELCQYLLVNALSLTATFHRKLDPKAAAAEDREAQELARALASEHPDWPSLRLMLAKVTSEGMTPTERVDLFVDAAEKEAAVEKPGASDPLLAEMQSSLGTRRVVALFGLAMLLDQSRERSMQAGGIENMKRFFDALVTSLGDAPEAPPFRVLRDLLQRVDPASGKEPAPEEMKAFTDAILAVPQPWPSDPVSVMALTHLHMMGFGMSDGMRSRSRDEAGEPSEAEREKRALAERFLSRFFSGCRINGLREGSLKQISTFYWALCMALASQYSDGVRATPEYETLAKRCETSVPDLAEIRRELADVRAARAKVLLAAYPPFAVTMAESLGDLVGESAETTLFDRFEISIEARPPEEQDRAREVAQAWRGQRDAEREERKGFGAIAAVAEKATCEVELASILNMLELFGMAMDVAAGTGDEKAIELSTRMRALTQGVQSRIKGRVFEPATRDWAAWRAAGGGAAPTYGSASSSSSSPSATSSGGGTSPWVWIAAGAALAAAAAAALLRRRRPRPPA